MFQILIVSFLLFDILWLIMAHSRLAAIKAPLWARLANLLFSLAMLAGISMALLLPRPLSRDIQAHLPWAYIAAIFLWHLMVAPIGLLILWTDTAAAAAQSAWARRASRRAPAPLPPPDPDLQQPAKGMSRRELLSASLIAAPPILLGATSAAGLSQVGQLRVRSFTIPIAGLHSAHDGLRIAHISDTHYGRFTDQAFTDHLVRTVNDLNADVHLVTGDLIDSSLLDLDHGLSMLRSIKNKLPIYCCVGNHDLFMSKAGFIQRVKASQTRLLVDEHETLFARGAPIQIFGMDWLHTDSQIQAAGDYLFRNKTPGVTSILLAHHPHAFDTAAPAGIDLTLSGHTHGGQVMLSDHFGPGPLMYRYWSGLYQKGDKNLVVSNGVGNWFPLRVNAPAEIVHITLVKA